MTSLSTDGLEESIGTSVSDLRSNSQKLAADFEALERTLKNSSDLQELATVIRQKFQNLSSNWEMLFEETREKAQIVKIVRLKRQRKEQRKQARTQELDQMEQQLQDKERTWQQSLLNLHLLLSDNLQKVEDLVHHSKARRRKYHESENLQMQAAEKELQFLVEEPVPVLETRPRPASAFFINSPNRSRRDDSITDSQIDAEYDKVLDEVRAENPLSNISGISMDKDVGGWDSSLESEHPSFVSSASADEIKRALLYLKKASLLSPVRFTQRNQHVLKQIGDMLAEAKDPGDVDLAVQMIKAQQKKSSQKSQKLPIAPKPPTPTHMPAWKRTLHISQPVEPSIDLASTTPKSEMMQIVEGLLEKTMLSNPPQSVRSNCPDGIWKEGDQNEVEDSLHDVCLTDIMQVPEFMGTEVTVQAEAEEEKVAHTSKSGKIQETDETGDQVQPFREMKVPLSTRKKRENTDYHYTGQTYQGSTKGSSGLKSKIALRTVGSEDSHFRLTGQSQSVLMTPQTKEKAL